MDEEAKARVKVVERSRCGAGETGEILMLDCWKTGILEYLNAGVDCETTSSSHTNKLLCAHPS